MLAFSYKGHQEFYVKPKGNNYFVYFSNWFKAMIMVVPYCSKERIAMAFSLYCNVKSLLCFSN